MCFNCFTRKGCPQLVVHTDRPGAKQWEQTFVKGIVSSLISRIQSQKVVSITSSPKRKGWFVAYQDLNKE